MLVIDITWGVFTPSNSCSLKVWNIEGVQGAEYLGDKGIQATTTPEIGVLFKSGSTDMLVTLSYVGK